MVSSAWMNKLFRCSGIRHMAHCSWHSMSFQILPNSPATEDINSLMQFCDLIGFANACDAAIKGDSNDRKVMSRRIAPPQRRHPAARLYTARGKSSDVPSGLSSPK
jgi:hypothetical protein